MPSFDIDLILIADSDPDPVAVAITLDSLRAQTRLDWTLRFDDDAHSTVATSAGEQRVVVSHAGVGDRVSQALTVGGGTYFGVVTAGDVLVPSALETLTAALDAEAGAAFAYADDEEAGLGAPTRKPTWSPERLRHQNYVGRPWLARTEVVRDVVARVRFDTAWEHDLLLSLGETARPVVAVPQVLGACATRTGPEPADSVAAVQRHLDRTGVTATAGPGPLGTVTTRRPLAPGTSVNVVIPTGWALRADEGGSGRTFVVEAVRELLAATDHEAVRVTVVYDEPAPEGALDELAEVAGDRLQLVPYAKPFDFSEKTNLGALADDADVIVLYNDDVLPAGEGWLETLVAPLADATVGVTGAKLRFPDGTIQSAGHRYYRTPETPSPVDGFRLTPADDPGPQSVLLVDREVSGVTGACLAVRRDVFDAVGGLTETLPHNYNDVDFCLKVRRGGWRILWIAGCEMTHYESQSRVAKVMSWEHDVLRERWGGFVRDAYLP